MNWKSVSRRCCFVIILVGYIYLAQAVMSLRYQLPAQYARASVLSVSPELLEIISGEFKGLVADYLILDGSYFLGGFHKSEPEDWETITLLFSQAMRLDPYFFTPIYYTQGILVWKNNVVRQAVELIATGHTMRFWDWEPGFYAGFDYHEFLDDDKVAAKYLRESAERPYAPLIVPSLAARYSQGTGSTDLAVIMLKALLAQATDEALRKQLLKKLLTYEGLLEIERAIEVYNKKHGQYPPSLQALVEDEIVSSLPQNMTDESGQFFYFSETGKVSFKQM